ncbi:MAG: carboxymuconolactone decarboxylase family protein [Bacteroidetes bacterium]|nr:MAG: carboxymuconolactone decarboxylase family protein [Bacteroidota bacterium]
MKDQPPKRFVRFTKDFPEVARAYSALGDAVHAAGPLDERTRALIKCAISGAARLEGGFHAHVRKARRLGISKEEVQHVALLAMPTVGFPHAMTLLSWIDDVYDKED